ncbi:hypothetical protein J1N35_038187 [Gossypium stocksii]|uniref:Uncharacterized protein n=1 Tax=Gossypium stocksii TaxID=47602 RepID=A0A9D3ZMF5_9ROSI|nr:hypothetical protein J1N35_038187 [Gossypium stocksii]
MKHKPRLDLRDRCAFHGDRGHNFLEDAIEEAMRNGELTNFVAQTVTQQGQSLHTEDKGKQKVRGTIHVIVGIDEDWTASSAKRKAHLRSVMSVNSPKRLCQQGK